MLHSSALQWSSKSVHHFVDLFLSFQHGIFHHWNMLHTSMQIWYGMDEFRLILIVVYLMLNKPLFRSYNMLCRVPKIELLRIVGNVGAGYFTVHIHFYCPLNSVTHRSCIELWVRTSNEFWWMKLMRSFNDLYISIIANVVIVMRICILCLFVVNGL